MTPDAEGGRTYDSEQVAAILRAAAELDQSRNASAGGMVRGGLTLAEIQQIAGEVGISAGSVQAASLQAAAPPAAVLGHRLERGETIPGEVPDRSLDELADQLRAVVGPRSTVRRTSAGLEVDLGKSDLGSVVINIRSAEGSTRVSLFSERTKLSEAGLTGSFLGLFGSLGLAANAPGAAVLAAAGLVGMGALLATGAGVGLGVGYGIWRLTGMRWRRRIDELYSQLLSRVAQAAENPPPERSLPP